MVLLVLPFPQMGRLPVPWGPRRQLRAVIPYLQLCFTFVPFFLWGCTVSIFIYLKNIVIFKSLLNSLQYCYCFSCFSFLASRCKGSSFPGWGLNLQPPPLEGEAPTSGLPGKSLCPFYPLTSPNHGDYIPTHPHPSVDKDYLSSDTSQFSPCVGSMLFICSKYNV